MVGIWVVGSRFLFWCYADLLVYCLFGFVIMFVGLVLVVVVLLMFGLLFNVICCLLVFWFDLLPCVRFLICLMFGFVGF